jgi:nucleotide-binding universal stress UspA family protein
LSSLTKGPRRSCKLFWDRTRSIIFGNHGIAAVLHHTMLRDDDIGATLIAEAGRLEADLIVMGGYGHSRLREWLLGGVTYELLHKSFVPLLVAH